MGTTTMKEESIARELEGARQALFAAQKELADIDAKRATLEAKAGVLSQQLAAAEETLSEALDERTKALRAFALDEIKKETLASIKNKYEKAQQNKNDIHEMLEMIADETAIIGNERVGLARQEAERKYEFWSHVMNELKDQALQHANLLRKLYLAYRMASSSGGGLDFGDFIERRIFTRTSEEKRAQLMSDLTSQYIEK